MSARLTEIRCFMWRAAGKTAMAFAIPLYVIDTSFVWLSKAVTAICTVATVPIIIFYDWCVKRHNALREPRP
ncbi:hypothetical protein [Mesorhizobium sp.]|uniref:hypothetical protein n=1 Tax=Mesorhizobium sp. TaxID=1871066 RepID=UPI000FE8DB0D|nr:hypothetical protein [Mesorhizobium sp.]RWP10466.1 MAG: hypothetical protein EOQ97_12895 [Mesorhizobium sp.]